MPSPGLAHAGAQEMTDRSGQEETTQEERTPQEIMAWGPPSDPPSPLAFLNLSAGAISIRLTLTNTVGGVGVREDTE